MSEDYFLDNWTAEPTLETRWETDIAVSRDTDAESRRQILQRPQRLMTARLTGSDIKMMNRLLLTLYRNTNQDVTVPLYTDVGPVTQVSLGPTLYCTTDYRRFEVGFDVIVLPWDGGEYGEPIVREVQAINATYLTLTSSLGSIVNPGALVFPALKGHQTMSATMEMVTDGVGQLEFEVLERASQGVTSLDASNAHTNPGGWSVYGLYPVFDAAHNWIDSLRLTYERTGDLLTVGKDQVVSLGSGKGRWRQSLSMQLYSREDFWSVLEFFDSRRGRLQAFWSYSRVPFFEFSTMSTGYVAVVDQFDLTDLNCMTYVAVVEKDGTVTIREITGGSVVGDDVRIAVTPAFPVIADADVLYVGMAMLSRFDQDALEENWSTDAVCSLEFDVVEVLEESDHVPDDEIRYIPGVEYSAC